MAANPASDAPAARDFGPSLPALLRSRFGVRERVTTVVALGIALAIGLGALVHTYTSRPAHLVYRDGPVFNLQYARGVLHRVPPRAGELVRLETRKRPLAASISVSALHLPGYAGNVSSGLLPVYEDAHVRTLRRSLPAFLETDEGNAHVNNASGYQVGFRAGPQGRFTWGRDFLLVPGHENVREGVLIRLRKSKAIASTKREQHVLDTVGKALYSFSFGTSAP